MIHVCKALQKVNFNIYVQDSPKTRKGYKSKIFNSSVSDTLSCNLSQILMVYASVIQLVSQC